MHMALGAGHAMRASGLTVNTDGVRPPMVILAAAVVFFVVAVVVRGGGKQSLHWGQWG